MNFKKKPSEGKLACRFVDDYKSKMKIKNAKIEDKIHFLANLYPELEQLSSLLKTLSNKEMKKAFIQQNKKIVEVMINEFLLNQDKLCIEYLKKKGRL